MLSWSRANYIPALIMAQLFREIVSTAICFHFGIEGTRSNDITWFIWMEGMWALVEMDFGIMVACHPTAGAILSEFEPEQSLSYCLNLHQRNVKVAKNERGVGYSSLQPGRPQAD